MASGEMKLSMILSVIDKATSPLRAVQGAFDKVRAAGEGLQKVGEAMRVARENVADFTDRAQAGLTSIVTPALAVEEALFRLGNVVTPLGGDVEATLRRTREAAVAWQREHLGAAESYIAATEQLIGAGLDQAVAVEAASVAMRVANATMGDASAIAGVLGSIYGTLGDQTRPAVDELSRLGDVLTRAQHVFGIADLGALPGAMKAAAPAAQRFGLSVEQVVTYLGALESAGIAGGEAGKALANTLSALEGASQTLGFEIARTSTGGLDLVATLANLESRVGRVADMTPATAAALENAFGPAALSVQHLLSQTGALATNLARVSESAGAAGEAAARLEGTMGARLTLANQQAAAIKVQLAEGIAPALDVVMPLLTEAALALAQFTAEHPNLVATTGTLLVVAAAAGSVLTPILSLAGAMASVGGQALKLIGWLGGTGGGLSKLGAAFGAARAATLSFVAAAGRMAASLATTVASAAWTATTAVARFTAQALAFAARAAVQFVAGAARMAWSLASTLFPQTTAAIASFARMTASAVAYAATGAASFVAASARMAASLAGQLAAGIASTIASLGRLTASAVVYGASGAASFVAASARMAASLAGQLAAGIASTIASLGRLTAAAVLYATRGADRVIVATARMGAALFTSVIPAAAASIASFVKMGVTAMASLVPAFTAATAGALSFAAALLANPITWIVLAIIAAVALIYVYWEPIKEFFGKLWDGIKAAFISAGDAVSAAWDKVVGFFSGIWQEIKAAFDEGFVNGIMKVIELFSPVVWIAKAFNAVSEWLFGFSLFDAGSNIVNTIVDGIKAMASKPVEAMKSIVGKVRNLLPFSPAKEGPLRDLHRVKLVETVAEAVRPAPLVDAMRGVAGDAMRALADVQVPVVAPMPSPAALAAVRSAPASGGGDNITMNVTFNLGGGGPRSWVEELEAWLRDPANARRIANAVVAHQARVRRLEFA